jgi:hypothetical protein
MLSRTVETERDRDPVGVAAFADVCHLFTGFLIIDKFYSI